MHTRTKTSIVAKYEENGYVIVRNVLDNDLIEQGKAHINHLQEKHPTLRPESLGQATLIWIDFG